MTNPAIQVEHIGKKYRINHQPSYYPTLRDSLIGKMHALKKAFRGPRFASRFQTNQEEFWALQDVSFSVQPGECLAIIGRNGAGKSTLMKILSRITEPSAGRVVLRGRVASLLEVGTGFHPELTGRENIYLNGAILGMGKTEIRRKFDEIVDFAEVEKFLDTPIKRYSSGMYVRLAFAVAAHLEPDILLVDEVLSVGDADFQKKCLGKMNEVAETEGRTILFISHNMTAVKNLCPRSLWLEGGRLLIDAATPETISHYLATSIATGGERLWEGGIANPGVNEFKLLAVATTNHQGEVTAALASSQPFFLQIHYRINRRLPLCRIGFLLATFDGIAVIEAYDTDRDAYAGAREPGEYVVRCKIPANFLNSGSYALSIRADIPHEKSLVSLSGILTLEILRTHGNSILSNIPREGIVYPLLDWVCEAQDGR